MNKLSAKPDIPADASTWSRTTPGRAILLSNYGSNYAPASINFNVNIPSWRNGVPGTDPRIETRQMRNYVPPLFIEFLGRNWKLDGAVLA